MQQKMQSSGQIYLIPEAAAGVQLFYPQHVLTNAAVVTAPDLGKNHLSSMYFHVFLPNIISMSSDRALRAPDEEGRIAGQ